MASPPTPEGPNHMPPQLPDGWVAQLEGNTGRYYYVEMATARTQWDVPTQPGASVPSPFPTPQQSTDPYAKPDGSTTVPLNADGGDQTEADRSLLGNLAINAITGGKIKPQNQSGLGSLASSFLSGQSSHSGGSSSGGGGSGGIGGPIGHLVGSLFADKPNSQDQQSHSSQQSSGYGGSASAGGHQGGGMMGFFGGHHGSSNNNFGYSSTGQGSSGGYSEQAPPATYKPPGKQSSGQYGSFSGVNYTQVPQSQYDSHSSSVNYGTQMQQRPQAYAQGGVNTTGASQYGPMTSGSSQYGQTTSHSTTSLPLYGHNNLSNQSVYSQDNASFPGPPGEHHGHHHGHHHKPPQDSYGQQQNQVFPGPPNGPQNTSQNDYQNQQNNSYANQPPSTHTPSHPSPLAYGQQNGSSYAPQPQPTPYGRPAPPPQSAPYGQQQPPPYNPYPQSQTSFQPPPQGTPAYTSQNNPPYNPQTAQHNQASFNANASAPPPVPPMSSHPSQQGSGPGPGSGPNQGLTPGQHPYPPRPNSSQSATYPGQVPYPPRPTSGTGPSPAPGYTQSQYPPQPPPKEDFPIPVNHQPHPQQPAYGQPYGSGHPQAHLPHDGYLTGGLVFGQGGGAPPPPPSWRA